MKKGNLFERLFDEINNLDLRDKFKTLDFVGKVVEKNKHLGLPSSPVYVDEKETIRVIIKSDKRLDLILVIEENFGIFLKEIEIIYGEEYTKRDHFVIDSNVTILNKIYYIETEKFLNEFFNGETLFDNLKDFVIKNNNLYLVD